MYEINNEALEKEFEKIWDKELSGQCDTEVAKKIAYHFAEWQRQQEFEDLVKSDMTVFNKVYAQVKADVKQEIEKNAVILHASIYPANYSNTNFCLSDYCDNETEVITDAVYKDKFKIGDKVKILILKEE